MGGLPSCGSIAAAQMPPLHIVVGHPLCSLEKGVGDAVDSFNLNAASQITPGTGSWCLYNRLESEAITH